MSHSARDLYDGLVESAGMSLRTFFERADVSQQPEAKESLRHLRVYADMIGQLSQLLPDIAVPDWIQWVVGAAKDEATPASSEASATETMVSVAKGRSDSEWLDYTMEHLEGTGSLKELLATQNELAPQGEEMDYRRVRYQANQKGKKKLWIKEEPGPGTAGNYWRLPNVEPRPVAKFEPRRTAERTARRHLNNGRRPAPRKPRPEGYNVNAKLRDKLQFIVFSVIRRFAIKNKIVELLDDYEPGRYSALSVKQEITDMTRAKLFVKYIFGSDHTYGSPEWPNYTEDHSIFSLPNEYRPEGHQLPELDLR